MLVLLECKDQLLSSLVNEDPLTDLLLDFDPGTQYRKYTGSERASVVFAYIRTYVQIVQCFSVSVYLVACS